MTGPSYSQFASGIPTGRVGLGPDDIIDAEVVDIEDEDGKAKPDTKAEPEQKPQPKTDVDEKPATRDGKSATDTKTAPDADGKPKASAGQRFMRAAGIPDGYLRQPIKGIPSLYKAQAKAGVELSRGALAKAGMKGMPLKTMARLLPGVGAVYGAIQAWNHAKNGDLIGGALNLLGVIPGPIGWLGIGAAALWDAFNLGGGKPQMWDQPDGETTHILPASAKDIGGVQQLDQQLRTAQASVYSFKDGPTGTVWDANPPAALRLDTPAVEKAVTEWLGGIADLFTEVDKVMATAGEAYFDEYQARLKPHLDAMSGLREQVKPFMSQLTAASDGGAEAYKAVLDANRAAREQLAADGKLGDQGPAQSFGSSVTAAVSKVSAADQNLSSIFSAEPPAVLTPTVSTGTGTRVDPSKTEKPVQTPAPAAQTPVTQAPAATPAKTATPQKTDDELSKLLNSLTQQKPTTPTSPVSTPNLGSGSGLGGGSPLNSGGGGGSPLGSQQSKPLSSGHDRKLDDGRDKKLDDKKAERKLTDPSKDNKEEKKPTPLSASTTENGKTKPAALTTEQKPGNATAVPAEPAAAATPAAPAAQGQQPAPEQSKEVDVKGNKTVFPDAKTAKMAQLLAAADPAHPMPLAEAAKAAGLTPPVPGQDPGTQVAPAQAKPGDLLVSGDKQFMLLGDGRFYDLQDYKVLSADQLPQDAGSRGGYFHLNEPAPTGAPGTQPVSGPTTGAVDQQVPGGTPPPAAPADASSPKPADAAPAAGAPAPGGVPSGGAPGAPKAAAAGGPSSAEATQTGTGQLDPSVATPKLDPNAVR